MRIMLDTNVLVSSLLFPNSRMNMMMDKIFSEHELILSSYVIEELRAVIKRKFPSKKESLETLLRHMTYTYVCTPEIPKSYLFLIRDDADYPVLFTAL